jgi:four helix bundle protein
MTYQRFEDLPVWQEAMRLAHGIYDLTENPKFKCSYSLRDQIERSSMSVSDNVAEGFERGTTNELLAFIYIARLRGRKRDRS